MGCMTEQFMVLSRTDGSWEVAEVLASRKAKGGKGRGMEYLVRWEPQGKWDDSWEPERNLITEGEKIDPLVEFERAQRRPAPKKRKAAAGSAASPQSSGMPRAI